jgi:hypothetical protein
MLLTTAAANAADTTSLQAQLAVIKKHRDSQVAKLGTVTKFPTLAAKIQELIDSDDRKIQIIEEQLAPSNDKQIQIIDE